MGQDCEKVFSDEGLEGILTFHGENTMVADLWQLRKHWKNVHNLRDTMIDTNKLLSRQGPSKRYTELLTEYQNMHKVSDGMFNGRSLVKFIDIIKNYLDKHECKSLIDYGCGKGLLYTEDFKKVTRSNEALQVPLTEYWGLDKLALFDPGHEEHNKVANGFV